MGQLLWKKRYKNWRLYYLEYNSFFAYKHEKAYVKERELQLLAIIKYKAYPDVERLKPCDDFELLQKLGLIDIRYVDHNGYFSRRCYFDITWEPYAQIPLLIIARTLIDGLGLQAFGLSISETWEAYLNRFDITTWMWKAIKRVLRDIPTEELLEFLIHDCPAIADVAGDVVAKRHARSTYRY